MCNDNLLLLSIPILTRVILVTTFSSHCITDSRLCTTPKTTSSTTIFSITFSIIYSITTALGATNIPFEENEARGQLVAGLLHKRAPLLAVATPLPHQKIYDLVD